MTSKAGGRYPNIILIVIDALRARNLGCYGNGSGVSPNIDRAAREGVLFENAFSAWNTTDQSLTSILTGRYPRTHGITHHGDKVQAKDLEVYDAAGINNLAQILKERNYNTMAVDWMARWFTRGFDYYGYEKSRPLPSKLAYNIFKLPYIHIKYMLSNISLLRLYSQKRKFSLRSAWDGLAGVLKTFRFTFELARVQDAGYVTDLGMDLINRRDSSPFFLFLHYWDTHTPYNAPRRFRPQREKKAADAKEHLQDLYQGAVKYVDHHIGRLMDFLRKKNLRDNTWLIITSDHGESLTEHGIFFDHHGLYDVTTHCPLVFHFPEGFMSKDNINGFVQHIDLVPTLCEWLNIPHDKYNFDGLSLLPLLRGEKNSIRDHTLTEESYVQRKIGIRENDFKYIFAPDNKGWCKYCEKVHKGVEELYHLREDPGETINLVARHPEKAVRMRSKLERILNALNHKRQIEFVKGKAAGLKNKHPEDILPKGRKVFMKHEESTSTKMKSMRIKLPEPLINALEEMARDTEFDGKEELVSFLVQEVFSGESSMDSSGEDKKIQRKLRSLGYMD